MHPTETAGVLHPAGAAATPNAAAAVTPEHPEGPAFAFNNSFARLPDVFFRRVELNSVRAPRLMALNEPLARALRLDPDALRSPAGLAVLVGNRRAAGSEPLAQVYAGHQFGYFVPQLGDGRAMLLGEVEGADGRLYDVQLKGSGRTPFSRGGDGRAAVGPVLREYLVSEAMTALGVPSTRALAAVATGETVLRETALPGAVLTRIAASHLRVGTFQFFAAREDAEAVRRLATYALERHYPERASSPRPAQALLEGVIDRQARLVAQWMSLGFVHGVMNTDNTSISGQTIDYGPCAFLEAFDPNTVFSSIDRNGRYAYRNQPAAMLWNLMRLAESLLPALEAEHGNEEAALQAANLALAGFEGIFEAAHQERFAAKLGLQEPTEEDKVLIGDLLDAMAAGKLDFTLFFRRLCDAAAQPETPVDTQTSSAGPGLLQAWALRWRERLQQQREPGTLVAERMRTVNPAYIPRNHQVEAALQAATQREDLQPFQALLAAVLDPYVERPGMDGYMEPARPDEQVRQTFCGT